MKLHSSEPKIVSTQD